jgi:hypothetical protein
MADTRESFPKADRVVVSSYKKLLALEPCQLSRSIGQWLEQVKKLEEAVTAGRVKYLCKG